MDTKAIASEIVSIKNRLEEIAEDDGLEASEAEVERARLAERLRFLQGRLSDGASETAEQDQPAEPDDIQYLPPA